MVVFLVVAICMHEHSTEATTVTTVTHGLLFPTATHRPILRAGAFITGGPRRFIRDPSHRYQP
jgi:ribulose-5-phosphate 4-epimerase/fuculose-1-phosphate aldolase